MTGIADMFDDLDGYERYDRALEEWGAWRVKQDHDKERRPERKSWRRSYMAKYRAERPWLRAEAVARTAAWRAANREKARAAGRKHELRRRERAKTDPVFREKYLRIRRESARRQRERRAT